MCFAFPYSLKFAKLQQLYPQYCLCKTTIGLVLYEVTPTQAQGHVTISGIFNGIQQYLLLLPPMGLL